MYSVAHSFSYPFHLMNESQTTMTTIRTAEQVVVVDTCQAGHHMVVRAVALEDQEM